MERCEPEAVVKWLRAAFVEKEDSVVAREEAFEAYVKACVHQGIVPTNNASFGKLFKSTFPMVGTTRLGKRGSNKMHHLHITWRHELDPDELRRLDEQADERARKRQERAGMPVPADGEPPPPEEEKKKRRRVRRRMPTKNPTLRWAKMEGPEVMQAKQRSKKNIKAEPAGEEEEEERGKRVEAEAEEQEEDVERMSMGDRAHRRQQAELRVRQSYGYAIVGRRRSADSPNLLRAWETDSHLHLIFSLKRYSNYYKRETWPVCPINPLSLKTKAISYLITTDEGREEVSPLALCAYAMISLASFMHGDFAVAEEYYHKARDQLGELFDVTDYDVASILVAFGWWSQMYSKTEQEGRQKELNMIAIGMRMCENLGAVNDIIYDGFIRRLSVREMRDPSERLAAAKRHAPFQCGWKQTKLERPPSGLVHDLMGDLLGTVLHCYAMLMSGAPLTTEQRTGIIAVLHQQIQESRKVEQVLRGCRQDYPHLAPQLSGMILCTTLGLRTLIYELLDSPKRYEAAREMVMYMVGMEAPNLIITLLDLLPALIRPAVVILSRYRDIRLLRRLLDALEPFKERYYWMKTIYDLSMEQYNLACASMASSTASLHAPLLAEPPTEDSTEELASESRLPPSPASFPDDLCIEMVKVKQEKPQEDESSMRIHHHLLTDQDAPHHLHHSIVHDQLDEHITVGSIFPQAAIATPRDAFPSIPNSPRGSPTAYPPHPASLGGLFSAAEANNLETEDSLFLSTSQPLPLHHHHHLHHQIEDTESALSSLISATSYAPITQQELPATYQDAYRHQQDASPERDEVDVDSFFA